LSSSSYYPGFVLGHCGIAYQRDFSSAVNVIWGNNAWGLTNEQIKKCLAGGLWLDAEAVEILVKRGYGKHLGIKTDGWLEREKSLYAAERIVSPKTGVRVGFNLNCNLMSRMLLFQCGQGAESWTNLVDCFDRRMGSALSVYRNDLGGTVAVSASPLTENWPGGNGYVHQRQMVLNYQRQILAQSLIKTLAGRKWF